jgi:hypothetical protein
VYLVGLHM